MYSEEMMLALLLSSKETEKNKYKLQIYHKQSRIHMYNAQLSFPFPTSLFALVNLM